MRAVVCQSPGDPPIAGVTVCPDPVARPGEVLIGVRASGVSFANLLVLAGRHQNRADPPFIPGTEVSGEVLACGEGVRDLAPGDAVCASLRRGGFAECAVAPRRTVYRLPEGIGHEAATHFPTLYGTAYAALRWRARLQPGETVLVHGAAGGTGLAAIQFARQIGCTVIATAGTEAGLHQCIMSGADFAVNHREADYERKLLGLTDQKGPDIIIEMLANVNLARDLALIAQRGRITIVGNRGEITINPRGLMAKDATVTGMSLFNATDLEWALAMRATRDGLAHGTLNPVVRDVLPLAQAATAHELIMQDGSRGKIVLKCE